MVGGEKPKKRIIKVTRKSAQPRAVATVDRQPPKPNGYRELLNNIYDAVLITDADASIIEANSRATDFFKYPTNELVGMDIRRIITDADISFLKTLKTMPASRYALIETRCQRNDGSYFPAEIAVKSLGGQGNNISFFVRNITKRKEAEAELRLINNAVRNSLTAVLITNVEGDIQYANPAAQGMLGELFSQAGNDKARIQDAFLDEEAISGAMTKLKEMTSWRGEMLIKSKGTRQVHVQVAAAPNWEEAELTGFVFSIIDITQQKEVELERQRNDRNTATIATLGAACHHLSQPATVICINAEIMGSMLDIIPDDGLREMIHQNCSAAIQLQEKLRELNEITLFRTELYLNDSHCGDDISNMILKLDSSDEEQD